MAKRGGGNGYVDIFAGTGVEEGGLLMDAGYQERNYGQHNLAGQISAVLTAVNFRALTVKNARGAILSKHSCGRVYKLSRAFNK